VKELHRTIGEACEGSILAAVDEKEKEKLLGYFLQQLWRWFAATVARLHQRKQKLSNIPQTTSSAVVAVVLARAISNGFAANDRLGNVSRTIDGADSIDVSGRSIRVIAVARHNMQLCQEKETEAGSKVWELMTSNQVSAPADRSLSSCLKQ